MNKEERPVKVYVIHGELTTYGEHKDSPVEGSEVMGVTRDRDLADMMAEIEVVRYANQAGSQWVQTSKRRWKAWEPGEFAYVVEITEREDDDA